MDEKYEKIRMSKKEMTPEKLCEGLPEEIKSFYEYCLKLEFEENPDYKYLKKLLHNIAEKNLIVLNGEVDF